MGFFSKKINEDKTIHFLITAYSDILSKEKLDSNTEKLIQVKKAMPLLIHVKQSDFDKQLTAVKLELLSIAWTKYMVSKIGMDSVMNYILNIKPKVDGGVIGLGEYDELMSDYNKAFAYGIHNGFATMAEYFISQLLPNFEEADSDELGNVVSMVSDLIAGSYSVSSNLVKQAGLIS